MMALTVGGPSSHVVNRPSFAAIPSSGAPLTAAPLATLPASMTHAALPTSPSAHLGHFQLPGPHPSAWGPSGVPPGAQFLRSGSPMAPHHASPAGTQSSANWDNRFCAGLWPGFSEVADHYPQGAYAPDCYGHDEPGIQFYSNLPGSGGNVSWNITLPIDRSPTLNQSNLYSAMPPRGLATAEAAARCSGSVRAARAL
ncbi:MAG: hypothetical protein L3K15_00010 [Thermoplasmata archaeon]|nr:hypothetical protein [Thermoplasmata archaeon]